MSNIELWKGPEGQNLPADIDKIDELVQYAKHLTEKQALHLQKAFEIEAYDMAAEYAWKKAMIKLKETLSNLGMEFIGEMIGRENMDEYTILDEVLTDYTSIELAEKIGVIGSTAAIKLRHANELINHFFSSTAKEEIDRLEAMNLVKNSIQYILSEDDIAVATEFSKFRDKLLGETLSHDDSQIELISNSPLFYLRTVNSILLSSIKNDIGIKLENSIANFHTIIVKIWDKLSELDKWKIGNAYRDVTSSGKNISSVGLKSALLKVQGFDFVPENLRSTAYVKAARKVIDTHFDFNNFYNEPAVIKKLASLGTTVPTPALIEVMQAYLAVYLGSSYGTSGVAAEIAEEKLLEISQERWKYYLKKVIHTDETILYKIEGNRRINAFKDLLIKAGIIDLKFLPNENQKLYEAIMEGNKSRANSIALKMASKLKK